MRYPLGKHAWSKFLSKLKAANTYFQLFSKLVPKNFLKLSRLLMFQIFLWTRNLKSFLLFLIDNLCIFNKRNMFTNIFEFFSISIFILKNNCSRNSNPGDYKCCPVYQFMIYNTGIQKKYFPKGVKGLTTDLTYFWVTEFKNDIRFALPHQVFEIWLIPIFIIF